MGLRKLLRRRTATDDADLVPGGAADDAQRAARTALHEHQGLRPVGRPARRQWYLLGGPHEPTCEVVQVETAAPEPDGTRRIRRCLFDTFGGNHPAGTLVTPVTVGRVADRPPG